MGANCQDDSDKIKPGEWPSPRASKSSAFIKTPPSVIPSEDKIKVMSPHQRMKTINDVLDAMSAGKISKDAAKQAFDVLSQGL